MRAHAGAAAAMFEALHAAGVNIQMITTSEIRVTCVVDRTQVARAVNALHEAFDLAKGGIPVRSPQAKKAAKASRAEKPTKRLKKAAKKSPKRRHATAAKKKRASGPRPKSRKG